MPGSEVGEDLRQGALVGVRHDAVGVDVEVVAVALLPRPRAATPFVLPGHVVEHQVEHQRDPLSPKVAREMTQVVHGAEVGPDGAVVLDRIAAVVVALARLEQGHEV